jgi:hypothetical protein
MPASDSRRVGWEFSQLIACWDRTVAGVAKPIRTYNRFSEALRKSSTPGFNSGMHYRNSTRIGANLGKQVSRFTTTLGQISKI